MITMKLLEKYVVYLREEERTEQTIQKYCHDIIVFMEFLGKRELTKGELIQWKETLVEKYTASSVNTMIASIHGFLKFMGRHDLRIKPLKIQRQVFCDEKKELSREEYFKLVYRAKSQENQRLALLLQTICGTGIRVSELQFITVEAVETGKAEVNCKGKRRTIFLPKKLQKALKQYLKEKRIKKGSVFVTKNGKPLHRSNIWRDMKALCEGAGVAASKVFPHNLRHLFARAYYAIEKDLVRLADLLGHTNIATTRIYTIESGEIHRKQMNDMKLVLTT